MITKYLTIIFCIFEFVQLPLDTVPGGEPSSSSAQALGPSTSSCGDLLPPYAYQQQVSVEDICYMKHKGDSFYNEFDWRFSHLIEPLKEKIPIDLINPIFEGLKHFVEIDNFVNKKRFDRRSEDAIAFENEIKHIIDNPKLYRAENHVHLTHLILTNDVLCRYFLWNISYLKPIELIWKSVSIEEKIQRIIFNAKLLFCGDVANKYEQCIRSQVQIYYSQKKFGELDYFLKDLDDNLKEILHNKIILDKLFCPMVTQTYLMGSVYHDRRFDCINDILKFQIQKLITYITDAGYSRILDVELTDEDFEKLSYSAQYSFRKYIFNLRPLRRLEIH